MLLLCISSFAVAGSAKDVYNYKLKTIDGDPVTLGKFHGKVLLLVNVASACGITPQYTASNLSTRNTRIAASSSSASRPTTLANQESGTEAEIKTFCNRKYMSLPMIRRSPSSVQIRRRSTVLD